MRHSIKADTSDAEWNQSRKKPKNNNGQCMNLDRRNLIILTNVDQSITLLEAARNFHPVPVLHIAKGLEEGLILDVKYHKNSRSTFLLSCSR